MKIELRLNGHPWTSDIDETDSLLDVLRRGGETSVKAGCEVGVCGACSVIVDGRIASACLFVAALADGAEIWTAAGLVVTHPEIAASFAESEGFQCGACTPGQVVACWSYLHTGPAVADEDEIRRYMSGNLCRCTGYASIVEAVQNLCND